MSDVPAPCRAVARDCTAQPQLVVLVWNVHFVETNADFLPRIMVFFLNTRTARHVAIRVARAHPCELRGLRLLMDRRCGRGARVTLVFDFYSQNAFYY